MPSPLEHLLLDNRWYGERNREGHQMDPVGDYVGTEHLLPNGDSYLSYVA